MEEDVRHPPLASTVQSWLYTHRGVHTENRFLNKRDRRREGKEDAGSTLVPSIYMDVIYVHLQHAEDHLGGRLQRCPQPDSGQCCQAAICTRTPYIL